MTSVLNHIKKGDSLENKQLVIVNSTARDKLLDKSSSFTYTFDKPAKRICKVDLLYSKVIKSFYNVSNDNVNMEIVTKTFDNQSRTDNLNVDDTKIKSGKIEATNIKDGTVNRYNTFGPNAIVNQVVTNGSLIYSIGTFSDGIVDFYDFNKIFNSQLSNTGLTDIFISVHKPTQELKLKFKITGSSYAMIPKIAVTQTDMYISCLTDSYPLQFFNANNSTDTLNNIYTIGSYNGIICRYSNLGEFQWRLKIQGIKELNPIYITLDDTESFIYVCGTYINDLKFYDKSDKLITTIVAATDKGKVFLAKYSIDGVLQWQRTFITICLATDIAYSNNRITAAIIFRNTLTINNNILYSDGDINIAIITYNSDGDFIHRFKIGGSSIDINAKLKISKDNFIITGNYSSNPTKFYDTFDNVQHTINNTSETYNGFIVNYKINGDTVLFNYCLQIESIGEINITGLDITTENEIFVIGSYNRLTKFYDIDGYDANQNLLNSGSKYAFIAKYGLRKLIYRAYITADNININSIDVKTGNVYIATNFSKGSINLFNANNTLNKTINILGNTNSNIISYIDKFNNFTLDTKTFDKIVISKSLIGDDLNYVLNLNAFSQSIGFENSQEFIATIIGGPISWTTININDSNSELIILFKLADLNNKVFTNKIITFKLNKFVNYTPYALVYELNSIINTTIDFATNLNPISYDSNKRIFYIRFNIYGTFTINDSILVNKFSLNLPTNIISPHIIISDKNIDLRALVINDTSKLTIKIEDKLINQKLTDGTFSDAFPNIFRDAEFKAVINKPIYGLLNNISDKFIGNVEINDKLSFQPEWSININDFNIYREKNNTKIRMSDDSLIQVAIIKNRILVSINSGLIWNIKEFNRTWSDISVSPDGNIIAACVNNGFIYISTDYGNTWNSRESVRPWASISITSSKMVAVATLQPPFISTDNGVTWLSHSDIREKWTIVIISSDGNTIIASSVTSYIYISKDVKNIIWNNIQFGINPYDIAMSANGLVIVSADTFSIIYSFNSGVTFNIVENIAGIHLDSESNNISLSRNGKVLVIGGDDSSLTMFTNTTFTQFKTIYFSKPWLSIATNIDGSNISAIANDQIYRSINSGATFEFNQSNKNWCDISISQDNSKILVPARDGLVYISFDLGNTWDTRTIIKTTSTNLYEVVINWVASGVSSNGKTLILAADNILYISTDILNTIWDPVVFNDNINDVAISFDGNVIVVTTNKYIHRSINNIWEQLGPLNKWGSVAMSYDGNIIVAVVLNTTEHIYILHESDTTFLPLTSIPVNNWSNINTSLDGSTIIAVSIETNSSVDNISISTDYGATFRKVGIDGGNSASISHAGDILITNPNDFLKILPSTSNILISKFEQKNWRKCISSEYDNTKLAIAKLGKIYKSIDINNDIWNSIEFSPKSNVVKQWGKIVCGSNISAVIEIDGLNEKSQVKYAINNNTFTSVGPFESWSDISISQNGNKILALSNDIYPGIYRSNKLSFSGNEPYFQTWDLVTRRELNYIKVCCSNTNKHVALCDNKNETFSVVFSVDNIYDWQIQFVGNGIPSDICITENRLNIIVVTHIGIWSAYTENNITTWVNVNINKNFRSVRISNNSKMAIATSSDGIYYSTDTKFTIWTLDVIGNWGSIAITNTLDTIYKIAHNLDDNYLYASSFDTNTNTNTVWGKTITGKNRSWSSLAFFTPTTMVATVFDDFIRSIIFIYDAFTERYQIPTIIESLSNISTNNDGSVIALVTIDGILKLSNNSGKSWATASFAIFILLVSISGTGKYMIALTATGLQFVSNDFGNTWVMVDGGVSQSIRGETSISKDGAVMFCAYNIGQIFSSIDFGITFTKIYLRYTTDVYSRSVAVSSNGLIAYVTDNDVIIQFNYPFTTQNNLDNSVFTGKRWNNIVTNSNGSIILGTMLISDYLYISKDYGVTWNQIGDKLVWRSIKMSEDGINIIGTDTDTNNLIASNDGGLTFTKTAPKNNWITSAIANNNNTQIAITDTDIYIHNFKLLEVIDLTVKDVENVSNRPNVIIFNEITDNRLVKLNDINMSLFEKYNIQGITSKPAQDIFIQPGIYTPDLLISFINKYITNINPLFINAFQLDPINKRVSFTSIYTGDVLKLSGLLLKMGFIELPEILSGNKVIANNSIDLDIGGPSNVFLKSNVIGNLRKNKTIFSNNKNLENIIAPLNLNVATNSYEVSYPVEVFLNKKETITYIDIHIVDENGIIINLNGGDIQINFQMYSA